MFVMFCFPFPCRVAIITNIGLGVSHAHMFSDRVEGRYVILSLSGQGRILTLCEVEVYGYHAPTGESLTCQIYAPFFMFNYFGTS